MQDGAYRDSVAGAPPDETGTEMLESSARERAAVDAQTDCVYHLTSEPSCAGAYMGTQSNPTHLTLYWYSPVAEPS
jgi:hypothetical protein